MRAKHGAPTKLRASATLRLRTRCTSSQAIILFRIRQHKPLQGPVALPRVPSGVCSFGNSGLVWVCQALWRWHIALWCVPTLPEMPKTTHPPKTLLKPSVLQRDPQAPYLQISPPPPDPPPESTRMTAQRCGVRGTNAPTNAPDTSVRSAVTGGAFHLQSDRCNASPAAQPAYT